jgi:hypothetical protein
MKPENKLLALFLLGNSILFSVVYFVLAKYFPIYIVYLAVGAIMTLIFVIYNRGFVGKDLKPEHLPNTMSFEEKQKFIDDCATRLHRSRWMITVIFPIILAFCLDMMYLFLLPMLEGMFQ